jgi:hypothetical protein
VIGVDATGIAGTQSPLALGMGLGVGLLQRRLVGPRLGAGWPWVAATTIGLSLPFAIVDLLPLAGVGVPYSLGAYVAAGGALVGVLQWRLLRTAGFERAVWWAVLTPAGWMLAGSTVSVAQWLPRSLGPIAAVFYLAIVMSGGLLLGVTAALAWRLLRAPAAKDAIFEFRVANNTSGAVAFYVEPWGGKYIVPSHGALRVVIEAPSYPMLEWEVAEDAHLLAVHGPAGALATVYDGETRVQAK